MYKVIWICVGMALCGCAGLGLPSGVPVLLEAIKVNAAQNANGGDATSLDVLIIYDKDLLETIQNMNAAEYFSKADALEENNPNGLQRFHMEVVAGGSMNKKIDKKSNRAVAALIFADIHSPGAHRYRMQVGMEAHVKLLYSKLEVNELEGFKLKNLLEQMFS